MALCSINQYLQEVEGAIQNDDGQLLSELLSCRHPHMASPRLILSEPETAVGRVIDTPWDEIVSEHLKTLANVSNHNFIDAYRHQNNLVQIFAKVFQNLKDENWALPVMYSVCLDLRLLASSADEQLNKKGKGKHDETVEKAAEALMCCFRVCAADNRSAQEDSKRWGMLNVVNQLFKIYFKVNKLHLCKPLIRAIDSSAYKDQFSISQLVTYKYYVGRKAMFESDFKSAEENLTFAFQRCHKKSVRNKRLILIYLIPVKMLLGHMPSTELLKKYDLLQFSDVVKAVITGNLLALNEAMGTNESYFIKCGIYLILEKLKIVAFRNLFKKVCLILKSHQLPIEAFLVAVKMMEVEDVDLDEVNCIVANLIYEGKIKGYISNQHQKLVISKQNPFPPLSTLN